MGFPVVLDQFTNYQNAAVLAGANLSSYSAGDLAVVMVFANTSTAYPIVGPAGWNGIYSGTMGTSTLGAWWKVLDQSDLTVNLFTPETGTPDFGTTVVIVDAGTFTDHWPVDTFYGFDDTGLDSLTLSPVLTSDKDRLVLYFMGYDGASGNSWSQDSGVSATEILDTNGGNSNINNAVYEYYPSARETATGVFSNSAGTGLALGGFAIAIAGDTEIDIVRGYSDYGEPNSAATSISLEKPIGTQLGNWMYGSIVHESSSGLTLTPPTGWVDIGTNPRYLSGGQNSHSLFRKRAAKNDATTVGYVDFSGDGDFITTAHHADYNVPTDGIIDIRIDLSLADYENAGGARLLLISKWLRSSASDSWYFAWDQTDARMYFSYRNDSGTQTTDTSQPQTGVFTDGVRYQWRAYIDTSGGTNNWEFFYRSDGLIDSATGWTSAGTRTRSADTIQDTTTAVTIDDANGFGFQMKTYQASVTINGTAVIDADFEMVPWWPFVDSTSRSWAITGGIHVPSVYTWTFSPANQVAGSIVTVDDKYIQDAWSWTEGSTSPSDHALTTLATDARKLIALLSTEISTAPLAEPYYASTTGMNFIGDTFLDYDTGVISGGFVEDIADLTTTTETFTGRVTTFDQSALLTSFIPTESVFTDDFTGTDNDPPDTNIWTEDHAGTGDAYISSNRLLLDGDGTSNEARVYSIQCGDLVDVTWRVERSGSTSISHIGLLFQADNGNPWWGTNANPRNGYYVEQTSTLNRLVKQVNSSLTSLATITSIGTTAYRYRMRYNSRSGVLTLKEWQDGNSEPDAWTYTVTDTSLSGHSFRVFATESVASGSTIDNIEVRTRSGISLVWRSQNGGVNGDGVTFNFPSATLQEDDLVIVTGGGGRNADSEVFGPSTSGYTTVDSIDAGATNNVAAGIWYKFMGATPDTTVVCQNTGQGEDACAYTVHVLRGVDTTTPQDATFQVTSFQTSTTTPNPPAITVVTDEALVLVSNFGNSIGTISVSGGTPATYGSLAQSNQTDTYRANVGAAVKPLLPPASEDPGVFTYTAAGNFYTWTTAWRPIPYGPTLPTLTLYATGDGTIVNVVNELDTTTNLYQSIDDDPSTPTDTDWINNTEATASQFVDLGNTPADFGTMATLTILVRWRGQAYRSNISCYAQIYQSNETTSLSDEVLVSTATGNSSFANTTAITFTGVSTTASKNVWDGAKVRFRWA